MPLAARFYPYEPARPPEKVGCYEIAWTDKIVYIGMGRIAAQLQAHHRDPQKTSHRYRCRITSDRRRARQIENRELKSFAARHGRLPKYSKQF
jgi:hypothetical protein